MPHPKSKQKESETNEGMKDRENPSLNIDEMKVVLHHNINNNQFLEKRSRPKTSVEMKGESGLGKTSVSNQVADEEHLPHIKLNLAQIEELGDLVGYPIKQYFGFKGIYEGEGYEGRWIDEPALEFFIKQMGYKLTGENRMSYAPPFWIANHKKSGGILLIDDWTRGDQRFIQATMELISRQEYISWTLPSNWHIILTSNPDDGEYHVNTTDKAQSSRYIGYNLKFDIDIWARWAEENFVDGRCINFALTYPEIFTKEINPRTVTMFFDSISSLPDFEDEKSLGLITMMGNGSVGSIVSSMFATFIHHKLDKLMSPEEILDTKINENDILNKIFKLTHDGDDPRSDIAYIISTRLINYISYYVKNNNPDSAFIKRITKIFSGDIFQTDLAMNSIVQIYSSNKNKFQPMLLNKDLVKYISK